MTRALALAIAIALLAPPVSAATVQELFGCSSAAMGAAPLGAAEALFLAGLADREDDRRRVCRAGNGRVRRQRWETRLGGGRRRAEERQAGDRGERGDEEDDRSGDGRRVAIHRLPRFFQRDFRYSMRSAYSCGFSFEAAPCLPFGSHFFQMSSSVPARPSCRYGAER